MDFLKSQSDKLLIFAAFCVAILIFVWLVIAGRGDAADKQVVAAMASGALTALIALARAQKPAGSDGDGKP